MDPIGLGRRAHDAEERFIGTAFRVPRRIGKASALVMGFGASRTGIVVHVNLTVEKNPSASDWFVERDNSGTITIRWKDEHFKETEREVLNIKNALPPEIRRIIGDGEVHVKEEIRA